MRAILGRGAHEEAPSTSRSRPAGPKRTLHGRRKPKPRETK